MHSNKVWYVTGASRGLGLTLVQSLLSAGFRVAATSRNAQALRNAVGVIDTARFLPLTVDLNNPDCVDDSIIQTLDTFGQIDVVVNNAGYGMTGTLEETTEDDIKDIFNVNVLAGIDVIKSVLPVFRRQRSGYIINIGSVAGFAGAPGWAVYAATKAAIAALSEVLAKELQEFGIKVMVAEPSGFRTGFLSAESLSYTPSTLEGYKAVKETHVRYLATDGQQAGDPAKAAEVLIKIVSDGHAPQHLFLGRDAYRRAADKLSSMTSELEAWKATTLAVDFEP